MGLPQIRYRSWYTGSANLGGDSQVSDLIRVPAAVGRRGHGGEPVLEVGLVLIPSHRRDSASFLLLWLPLLRGARRTVA